MIRIICLGKLKDAYIAQAAAELMARMRHVEVIELKDEKVVGVEAVVKSRESERILKELDRHNGLIIAMDEHGTEMTSMEFASFLKKQDGDVAFVIGGALGLDKSILKRADVTLALSRMTFTHQMARLFLVEQLYRAECINKGKRYHK